MDSQTPEQRLQTLGINLPQVINPIGNFRNAKRVGNLVYISGQGPVTEDGQYLTGKVGADVSAEQAQAHAKIVAINILAVLKAELGELSKITSVIKLLGMVNAVSEFEQHPLVINGCSDFLCQILGDAGPHARSAFGVGSLPNNITVEIEAIVAVKED
ncbi:MAG: RidA family protein [Alphaproteobacteria bacterium]|nr:RidA family protein [Alphaproteobacteria bacterium]